MDNEKNPTEAEIRQYLVADNGWTDEEVDQLLGYYFRNINPDGTTTLSHDEWTRLAEAF